MANTLSVDQLGLSIKTPNAVPPTTSSYRPPSWPPPRDWVCVEDKEGNPISCWGDPIWDLWPWAGFSMKLNFGDGPRLANTSIQIDRQNADLFRMAMTWLIWGFRGPKSVATVLNKYKILKIVFATCYRNEILASDLSRYPRVVEAIPPSSFHMIVAELHTLLSVSELIGFTILDADGIGQLKAADPDHKHKQTEYIPPRIWQYQVQRLNEFIDDYLSLQHQIEKCFAFCVDVYLKNKVENHRKKGKNNRKYLPFAKATNVKGPVTYYGEFSNTAEQFGINNLLQKWVGNINGSGIGIRSLSTYLSMASYIGLAYTLNFTLARIKEGSNLRFNCLKWHDDEKYGRIPLIEGVTSKTTQDESALWVTSPSVERAIVVMQSVAKMRSVFTPSKEGENIFLMNYAGEPWLSDKKPNFSGRPIFLHYASFISRYPLIFEKDKLLITEEDFKIAISVNPTLDQNEFQIGKPWIFAWHQLRRTGAVNMFSSGEISDSSIQLQLKHLSPVATQFYGRGHTTLNLSAETRTLIINAQYEAMGRELAKVHTDRFISPFGDKQKDRLLFEAGPIDSINLMSEDDANHYEKAARSHQISFRRTVVGGCMKNGRCDGDGLSALSDCAGGAGRSPCANVLFDRSRATANKTRLDMVIKQIQSAQLDTPRYRYLEQERRGLENYFAYIK